MRGKKSSPAFGCGGSLGLVISLLCRRVRKAGSCLFNGAADFLPVTNPVAQTDQERSRELPLLFGRKAVKCREQIVVNAVIDAKLSCWRTFFHYSPCHSAETASQMSASVHFVHRAATT